MISTDRLSISFGGTCLFREVSFLVNSHDKIGLVGRNGAGKTTLLRTFMGMHQPDEGKVTVPSDVRLGYLPQQMIIKDDRTLFAEAETAFDEIMLLESEIKHITDEIARSSDYSSAEYTGLLDQLSVKTERFHLLEGTSRDQKVEQVLTGLGFRRTDFGRRTREFSGGWRMRIELAKILLKAPDVILLDEPTNHLDIDSIQWLEEFLKNYYGAVLLISHDRVFLDNVTTRTIEISGGIINDYRVPYSKYVELRKERREQQEAAYRNQQKKIEDTREFIERFRYKPTKAIQVQSRIRMLEKMEIIGTDEEDVSHINIRFPSAPRTGNVVVEADGLSFSYGENKVLDRVHLMILRGDHVAFVGRNGEGKTTFTRLITGELKGEGKLKTGYQVNTGYFAQNQDELLDENKTVLETLDDVATGDVRTKVRDILGAFLFSGEDADKKVKVLSGGERSRLAMARLLLQPYNLLILDEPTNHLDMRSKDILKQALLKYDGTLVVVSHDREFLDGLVSKVYEFGNRTVREHLGGIYDFLRRKRMESLKELESMSAVANAATGTSTVTESKQIFLQRKETDREIKKIENRIEKAENHISSLERRIRETEDEMAQSSGVTNADFNTEYFSNYKHLQDELKHNMEIWEKLHEELEQLKNKRI